MYLFRLPYKRIFFHSCFYVKILAILLLKRRRIKSFIELKLKFDLWLTILFLCDRELFNYSMLALAIFNNLRYSHALQLSNFAICIGIWD